MLPALGMLAVGAGTSLLGGLLGSGKKPKIPDYPTIDPDAEQRKALAGNMANFEKSAELTTRTNTYNQSELRRMLRMAIPGYDALVGKQGELVGSMLAGELPKDVVGQIQRNAAERAGAGGYGGSGMGRNLEARDLGLTSLQLTQQGLGAAERWLAGTKALSVPGQFDVASMFLTPAQRIQTQAANNAGQFSRDTLAANVAAAPDPMARAVGGLFSQMGGSLFGAGMTGMFAGPSTGAALPSHQSIFNTALFQQPAYSAGLSYGGSPP